MATSVSLTEATTTRISDAPRGRSIRKWRLTLGQLWVALAVVVPAVIALQVPLHAGDSAYQVRTGEMMLRTGALLRTDPFTFTLQGLPWTNQQWGAGILFALLYRAGGWELLAFVRTLLVASTFGLVYLACRASGARMSTAAWLTLASFVVALGYLPGLLSLRPQTFALVLFALLLWIVAARRQHPRAVWIIPVLVAIWANLHASFFLAFLLLGLAWLEDRSEGRGNRLLAVGAVALGSSLLNPFGAEVWTFVAGIATHPGVNQFGSEWAAPTLRSPSGVVFFLSAAGIAAFVVRRRSALPWPTLLRIGAFFVLGLVAVRGITWWALAMAPAMAALLPPGQGASEGRRSTAHTALATGLVLFAVSMLPWWDWRGPDRYQLLVNAPRGITASLDRVLEPGDRIFNEVAWGSWFELRFPRNPVFMDSRLELFRASLWDQYLAVRVGREGWQSILDRWRVSAVALDPQSDEGLVPLIAADPNWRLEHRDDEGVVFVRSGPEPGGSSS
jgi:hypothetical protein